MNGSVASLFEIDGGIDKIDWQLSTPSRIGEGALASPEAQANLSTLSHVDSSVSAAI